MRGEMTDSEHLSRWEHDTDVVTRTARTDRTLDRTALLRRASARRDLLIALHTAIQ